MKERLGSMKTTKTGAKKIHFREVVLTPVEE